MSEWRLFDTVPEWTTPGWYADREHAPHLEQEGHRERLIMAADMAAYPITMDNARTVIDLGAGDGGLLSLIVGRHPEVTARGFDLQPTNVEAAGARGVDVQLVDVVTDGAPPADLFLVTEILEHLADPRALLRGLVGRWLVASSPYTETDRDHYGFHTWAWDEPGYQQMLADCGWETVRAGRAWICQVVLARRAA